MMHKSLPFSSADNSSLANTYRQSHLCQNVLQELEHVSQSSADKIKGPDEVADYPTTFFYQVSKLMQMLSTRQLSAVNNDNQSCQPTILPSVSHDVCVCVRVCGSCVWCVAGQ